MKQSPIHQNDKPILICIFYNYTVWLTQKYALPSASYLDYAFPCKY